VVARRDQEYSSGNCPRTSRTESFGKRFRRGAVALGSVRGPARNQDPSKIGSVTFSSKNFFPYCRRIPEPGGPANSQMPAGHYRVLSFAGLTPDLYLADVRTGPPRLFPEPQIDSRWTGHYSKYVAPPGCYERKREDVQFEIPDHTLEPRECGWSRRFCRAIRTGEAV
jgi:hypothetical protein